MQEENSQLESMEAKATSSSESVETTEANEAQESQLDAFEQAKVSLEEAQMMKEYEDLLSEENSDKSPFSIASTLYGMYAPRFEQLVKELSTGQLRRLVNALVQYPLTNKEFIDEKSGPLPMAFSLGQALLEAKWIMFSQTMMQQQEQVQNAQERASATEESEIKKEEVNG
jgi:hypothetical protein